MATNQKTLDDAFYETLKDVYFAERQILKGLKKSVKAAEREQLKQAFQTHYDQTTQQIERIQEIFGLIGKPARGKTCEAIQGIMAEMEEDLEDFGDTPAGDAVLIGCAQAIEHYEIARYGLLRTWALRLGLKDAAKLLNETLQEEKQTDELLTKIAEAASATAEPT